MPGQLHRSMPQSLRRSRSLSQSKSKRPQADQFWNLRNLTSEEEAALEEQWNGRHHMHFSRVNAKVNPAVRDYFDRQRDDDADRPWVRSHVRIRSTWSLAESGRELDGVDVLRSSSTASLERSTASLQRIPPALGTGRAAGGWDDRHHVTVSLNNRRLHENQREYFTRVVAPRSKRVLPQRPSGITQHQYHYAMRGSPYGQDDNPSTVFMLDAGDELALSPTPHGAQPRLPEAAPHFAQHRGGHGAR